MGLMEGRINDSYWLLQAPEPREFEAHTVWQSFADLWQGFVGHVPYIIIGLIVVAAFLIISRIVREVIKTAGRRTRLDENLAELLGRLASFVVTIFGIFVAAVVVFPTFRPGDLIAGLGITSVAIGFAFKDVLQNFFAGILILWRRPFKVGDQIRFKEFEGTVEEINVRSTRIKTFDGERAVIPNGDIYGSAILVKTAYDIRRIRFVVGIGYLDSIEVCREAIYKVLRQTEGVLRDPKPSVYVSELASSSVNFIAYFWTVSEQANVLRISDRVATGIKLALDAAGIEMPLQHNGALLHDATGTSEGDID